MKYKEVELIDNTEMEFFIIVKSVNPNNEINIDDLYFIFDLYYADRNRAVDLFIHAANNDEVWVRSLDITFDNKGVNILKEFYELLCKKGSIKTYICVHTDISHWTIYEEYTREIFNDWKEFRKNITN